MGENHGEVKINVKKIKVKKNISIGRSPRFVEHKIE